MDTVDITVDTTVLPACPVYYNYYAPQPVYYDYYAAPQQYYMPQPYYNCWRWRDRYRYRVC